MKNENPGARLENIIVQELPDEVLLCDTSNNRMLCLNKTAAEVWKLADGKRSIKEISRLLSETFKSDFSEEMVSFALAELSRENLLIGKLPLVNSLQNLSRREVIRRVGLASMVALPVISSLTMPKAIHASSSCISDGENPLPDGCICDPIFSGLDCQSGCCNRDSVCGFALQCICESNSDCAPGQVCCPGLNQCRTRCPL